MSHYPEVILPVCPNLQDEHYDCGAASLKIILDSLGMDVSESDLMSLTQTSSQTGASPEHLLSALDQLKVKHQEIEHASLAQLEAEIRSLHLCLVDYQAWGLNGAEYQNLDAGHYSVIFGYSDTHLWIADPAKHHTPKRKSRYGIGVRKMRKDRFLRYWQDRETDNSPIIKRWLLSVSLAQKLPQ